MLYLAYLIHTITKEWYQVVGLLPRVNYVSAELSAFVPFTYNLLFSEL